jgi:tetratricopeptide (TPR) repeat protein
VRGEQWDKAHRYLEQAGLKALGRSANRDAAQCFEQALEALGRLPDSPERTERAIDLRLALRSALHPLGEFNQVFDTLRKASELAESIGDERRQGRVLSYLAQSFRLVGDYPRAVEAGERALAISRASGDLGILAPANFHLGQAFFNLGDHHRAIDFHLNNIGTLDGELARERLGMAGFPLVFSHGHMAWSLAELGRFSEGMAAWQAAVKLAEDVKHPFSEAFARYCGGFLYIRRGEVEQAIAHLEPGLAMCRAMNARLDLPFVAAFLGLAYVFQGRSQDGIPLLEEAIQEADTLKLRSGACWLLGMLAYGYRFADRLREAEEFAQRSIELGQEFSERSWVAWAQYFLGQIQLADGNAHLDGARTVLEGGLESARALQLRPLAARFELSLGHLHRRTREPDIAYSYLTNAVTNLRDMEIPYWLKKAEAELRELQVEA